MPTPSNLSYLYNMGFMLTMCLMIQIMSGLLLTMSYIGCATEAFESVDYIMRDINAGWIIRFIHANTASLMFMFMYIHIFRAMLQESYSNKLLFVNGLIIMLITMMIAFLGYVLPWGNMSFWGATVITSFMSVIPMVGNELVMWLWGGFSVGSYTLTRFYTLHFLMPFVLMSLVILHFFLLHIKGSSNPLSVLCSDYIPFTPYYYFKDIYILILVLMISLVIYFLNPYIFMDSSNFEMANPLVTPNHIKPEWYFLFSYAILRAVPSKLGGIILMLMSMLILVIFILKSSYYKLGSSNKLMKFTLCLITSAFIMLTILGGKVVEYPYQELMKLYTVLYFMLFSINYTLVEYYNKCL